MAKPSVGYENWLVVFTQPQRDDYFEVAELSGDSPAVKQVTFWSYTLYGAVGHSGILKSEVRTKPVTTAKERKKVDRIKQMVEKGKERSQMWYDIYKANKQPESAL